jgi:anti-sigma factor (TIGR02949 family)
MHSDEGTPGTPAMLDCGAAVRMLWDFLDGQLSTDDDAAVRAHMARCSHCFPHARFGELVLEALAAQRAAPEPGASIRDGVIARLRLEGYDEP